MNWKLVAKEKHEPTKPVMIGGLSIGGKELLVAAGPCAVESEEQVVTTAIAVKAAGARILRGGAYKPRTSPYSFQGLAEEGLKLLATARQESGLMVVSEVMDPRDVDLVSRYVDILQIGSRNMQNYPLLREVGQSQKPVLLKRGLASTIEEWLLAAEHVIAQGNENIILCERGIRTFESLTRNTLDLAAVPIIKQFSHLPIVVDPSHATGRWRLVIPMAKAAVAAGADGLMVEVHPDPDRALSDGPQSLSFANFAQLMSEIQPVAAAIGREPVGESEEI